MLSKLILEIDRENDPRPICRCPAYAFPHRVGGRCTGTTFAEFYFDNIQTWCKFCACNIAGECQVIEGNKSIKVGECYIHREQSYPGQNLPIKFEDISTG